MEVLTLSEDTRLSYSNFLQKESSRLNTSVGRRWGMSPGCLEVKENAPESTSFLNEAYCI